MSNTEAQIPILGYDSLQRTDRILRLMTETASATRYFSVEQARIITEIYRETAEEPTAIRRALAFAASAERIGICIDPDEIIVGNRTAEPRAGVVFPEAGIGWVAEELDTLPTRPQDRFQVRPEDARIFREEILPYWSGRTLEDAVRDEAGELIASMKSVVKINQTDHAQGHICPDVRAWLASGPAGLLARITAADGSSDVSTAPDLLDDPDVPDDTATSDIFRIAAEIVLRGSIEFIRRYAEAAEAAGSDDIAFVCRALAERPAESFREAVQSVWFLFVLLQLESNASSFSPGRMDQYLYPYFRRDLEAGNIDAAEALEIIEALYVKFNQIVYMRNSSGATYFAGFPIGFNVAVGGIDREGRDAVNPLSYLFLKAQEHVGMPQPNLSARLHANSPEPFVRECARVIGMGSGMPQIFNDESVVPALVESGLPEEEARDYAVVGCVELSLSGNFLGWSDAAMFNMVKALELALNDGICMLTGRRIGPPTGTLADFQSMVDVKRAFAAQIDAFVEPMIRACEKVDRLHAEVLPSPFLSCVVDGCIEKELDVTAGGARYNYSGIQAIQPANIADSLMALEELIFQREEIDGAVLLQAVRDDFRGQEQLRQKLLTGAPKYGNGIDDVDQRAAEWIDYFADRLSEYTNVRGGPYHMGLYTVSAHVPMGQNVGATSDGRRARSPLADGGLSAVYGRDRTGPTALLSSVSRIDSRRAGNGTLLNMKFLPDVFSTDEGVQKFAEFLRTFTSFPIHHAQFNVVSREELLAAREDPDRFAGLTVRVAGYTAYFVELTPELQEEIIARTSYARV